ncbi:protein FAM185A isoform X2 [Notechis scutatus]|uniref:Protein FAM185A isoform X2 n=1 Tax=Notechis scutatus TaxID=8663 RepID=A0A6J1UPX0_9SAUR|nr:protein FAM185A isoform X2 [Notechis scutatus]
MVHSRLPGWCYLAGKALSRSNRGLLKGKKSPHKVALFTSQANLGPTEKDPKTNKLLKEWTLVVTPFGLLKARLPCHITVGPLDPHKYPDSDKVFVALKGRDSNPDPASGLLVNYDEARKEVKIISDGVDGTASLDVRTPVNFDLDIKTTRNGSVKIEQMQCANCKVETEKGASVLKSIKNVNIEKLQGSSINITSENGLLKAKYLYAESSFLTSVAGDILLGNVHGDITLETKTGSITVGSINLKVPATLQTSLKLSGRKVEISPEIQLQEIQTVSSEDRVAVTGHMDQKDAKGRHIKAETQYGTINLKCQSWFQSLKLKIP